MARPETQSDVDDGEGSGTTPASSAKSDHTEIIRPGTGVVRPGTDVVRPGTDGVRPGTDVVRPGTGVVAPADANAAKARAVVPDAPERPLDPIHIVLPIIEVKPAKQGFLDRLVAPKAKKKKKPEPEPEYDDVDEAISYPSGAYPTAPPTAPPSAPPSSPGQAGSGQSGSGQSGSGSSGIIRPPQSASGSARVEAPRVDPTRPTAPPPSYQAPPVQQYQAPPAPPAPTRAAPPTGPRPPDTSGRRVGPSRPEDRQDLRRYPTRFKRRGRQAEYESYDDWAEDDHQPVRRGRALVMAVAVVVLALASAGTGAVLGARQPSAEPQWLAAAAGGRSAPVLTSLATDAPRPSAAGMAAQIQSMFSDHGLGGHVSASVVDVASGESIYDTDGATLVTPASTAKLATAAAVLHTRGAAYRLSTRVVAGTSPGEVVLIGGGDPTLAAGATGGYPGAARLDKLAEQVVKALDGVAPSSVVVDSSLFSGSLSGPAWVAKDVKDGYVANITALMTDGARINPKKLTGTASRAAASRYDQPDLAAGQLFAKALGLPASAVSRGTAAPQAQQLGVVVSPPIAQLVEMMLSESDNVIAEMLSRQVALATERPASFEGGAAATGSVLVELGLSAQGYGLVDGSGMSYLNKVSARLLTSILAIAASAEHPELRAILSGLPVAAYSGTLTQRYRGSGSGGAAAGVVRAKTGTLSGVNALAGMAVDADGRLIAFSIVADATTNSTLAEYAMDRIAAAIASCGCQ